MTRNLKLLGVMVVAALAMSAVMASAAQALIGEAGTFKAGATPETTTATEIHGAQYGTPAENVFSSFGETVSCTSGTYTGTDSNGVASSIILTPTYSGCTAGNGLPATVTHNGCTFRFNQPTTIAGKQYTGDADLLCAPGKVVEVHIYSGAAHGFSVCTLTMRAQEPGGHIIYTNVPGSKDHITAVATITGITAEEHGLCSSGATPHTTEATLNTKVTVKAYKHGAAQTEANQHALWLSDKTTP